MQLNFSNINARIRSVLTIRKISDKQLAQWLEISPGRLSQKFKGETWDSLTELQEIADRTGFSLAWVITGEGEQEQKGNNESHEEEVRAIVLKYEKQIEDLVAQIAEKNAQIELRKKNEQLLTQLNGILEDRIKEKELKLDELRSKLDVKDGKRK
ncbi:MAG: hypothetical protein WDO15_11240 [Bacteroidota bacterium]